MKNILVAIDNFETITVASPIIERTIELANAFSSKVWMLHVAPQPRQPPFNIDKTVLRSEVAHQLHDVRGFFQQLSKCLRDRNIEASSLIIEGTTVNTILHESERLNVDLIILGCHRHSELFGVLTKGTEEGLLGKCTRPVMFVPMPE